jgi:sec-independent protein translocase protein TatA
VGLGAPELLIILFALLLLFGSTKLPNLARSLGQAQGEFKKGMLPFIVVLANPSTGQAYASFANLAAKSRYSVSGIRQAAFSVSTAAQKSLKRFKRSMGDRSGS